MNKLLTVFITFSFNSLKAQESTLSSDAFLEFIRVEKNIKSLAEEKAKFEDSFFQSPPDSLTLAEIEWLYPKSICYWIEASPIECNALKLQSQSVSSIWKTENFKKIKITSVKNSGVNYCMLSEPITFGNFTIVVFKRHSRHGFTSGIEIYERTEGTWKLKRTLNPIAN